MEKAIFLLCEDQIREAKFKFLGQRLNINEEFWSLHSGL